MPQALPLCAVGSYPTFSPSPTVASGRRSAVCSLSLAYCPNRNLQPQAVCFLWRSLSPGPMHRVVGFRSLHASRSQSPGVTRHCALVSPDFPPRADQVPDGTEATRDGGAARLKITLQSPPWTIPSRLRRNCHRHRRLLLPRRNPRGRKGNRIRCRRRAALPAPRSPDSTGRASSRGRK